MATPGLDTIRLQRAAQAAAARPLERTTPRAARFYSLASTGSGTSACHRFRRAASPYGTLRSFEPPARKCSPTSCASGVSHRSSLSSPCPSDRGFEHLDYRRGAFPVAEALAGEALSLPIFPGITEQQLGRLLARFPITSLPAPGRVPPDRQLAPDPSVLPSLSGHKPLVDHPGPESDQPPRSSLRRPCQARPRSAAPTRSHRPTEVGQLERQRLVSLHRWERCRRCDN